MSGLSYTALDGDAIQEGLDEQLSVTPGLENYKDSSNMKIVTDAVKAMVDINNYNIERRAEEAYPGTSMLDSSAIGRANLLGHSVRMPKPAKSHVNIAIKGGIFSSSATFNNQKISFNKWFRLTYNDVPFVFSSAYYIQLTSTEFAQLKNVDTVLTFDRSRFINGSTVVRGTELIDIIQGEFKEITFDSSSNKDYFQVYSINDTTFSDNFGLSDPGYDESIVKQFPLDCYSTFYTFVGKNINSVDAKSNPFYIERHTLSRPDLAEKVGTKYYAPKVCMIRTNQNSGVDILFGAGETSTDTEYTFAGGFGERGNGSILVKYFSTMGAKANRSDLIGKKLEMLDSVYVDDSLDITDFVSITFARSVYNGADRESKQSIDINSPSTFSSKERLVTRKDYESYLKGLTVDGKKVYGAVAWSENEEIRARGVRAVRELANRTLFSVVSSLYEQNENGDWDIVKNIDESVIETKEEYNVVKSSYTSDGWLIPMFSSSFVSSYFTDLFFATKENTSVSEWTYDMDGRSLLAIVNRYVSPVIHRYKLNGVVHIGTAESVPSVSRKVKNIVYKFLDDTSNFKKSVALSNINTKIEQIPSVKYITGLNMVGSNGVVLSNSTVDSVTLAGTEHSYGTDVMSRIRVLNDVVQLFGKLTNDDVSYLNNLSDEDLFDAMFNEYFAKRYEGITYTMVETLHKYLFSASVLPSIVGKTFNFRSFNEFMVAVVNNSAKIYKDLTEKSLEVFKYDLFTMYNNILAYLETVISEGLLVFGDISNYTVGNEIVQVELDLEYVYG